MKAYIDKDKPHVIRECDTDAVIAVLVDFPLCREEIGKKIIAAINGNETINAM